MLYDVHFFTGDLSQETKEKQRQKDQELEAMTETRLKEPESNQMTMSHAMVKLETVRAERKQHALELEIMRQKYEALMKKAEDLTNENKVMTREHKRNKVEKTLRRKKDKKIEEKEMEKLIHP